MSNGEQSGDNFKQQIDGIETETCVCNIQF